MSEAKKTKLKKLEVNSVDLVPAGANPEAHINLFKAKESRPTWERFVDLVKKSIGMDEGEIEDVMKEHLDGSNCGPACIQKIENEMWDYSSAIRESLMSIVTDTTMGADAKEAMIKKSLQEFSEVIESCAPIWASGKETMMKSFSAEETELYKQLEIEALEERLAVLKEEPTGKYDPESAEYEEEVPEETEEAENELKEDKASESENDGEEITKSFEGGIIAMYEGKVRIDKSLLTEEQQAQLEELLKAAEVVETEPEVVAEEPTEEPVAEPTETVDETVDMNEVEQMAAEIASLKKSLQLKDMESVAKSYEVLGKDTAELAETLYKMKCAGEEVYKEFVDTLDIAKSAKEGTNATLFTEIGKSRDFGSTTDTNEKINVFATEIQKADPSLSRVKAIAKAWEMHPELVREYDGN